MGPGAECLGAGCQKERGTLGRGRLVSLTSATLSQAWLRPGSAFLVSSWRHTGWLCGSWLRDTARAPPPARPERACLCWALEFLRLCRGRVRQVAAVFPV